MAAVVGPSLAELRERMKTTEGANDIERLRKAAGEHWRELGDKQRAELDKAQP